MRVARDVNDAGDAAVALIFGIAGLVGAALLLLACCGAVFIR